MKNETEKYLRLSGQIGISYFFNLLIIVFQPLLISLLTRVLTVEEYGVYSLLFTTISILSVILRLGLVDFIRTKIPGMKVEVRAKSLFTLLSFSFLTVTAACLLLFIFRTRIISFLGIQNISFVWTISLGIIIFTTLNDLIDVYLISIQKISVGSSAIFLTRSLWVMLLLLTFSFFGIFSLYQVFVLWFWGALGSLLFACVLIRREVASFIRNREIDFHLLRSAIFFSLPLVLMVFFSFIIDASDRYILNYYLGKSAVAIYSLAYGLVTMVASLPLIFQSTIAPYLAEKWNLKEDPSSFFSIMLKYSLIIVVPSIIGVVVFREEAVALLSGAKYSESVSLIAVMAIYPLFAVLIELFNKTLLLRNMIKHTLGVYLAGALFKIIFSLLFVPLWGVEAAAYSTTLSFFLMFILLFFFRPKEISLKKEFIAGKRIVFSALLMGLFLSLFSTSPLWLKLAAASIGALIYLVLLFVFRVFQAQEKELIHAAWRQIFYFWHRAKID